MMGSPLLSTTQLELASSPLAFLWVLVMLVLNSLDVEVAGKKELVTKCTKRD